MKILSIHARNFRVHADTYVQVPKEGITGLIGSNESGKSSLLEAAMWALFGTDATRGTKDGIRWSGAPSRRTASVVLRFEVGGKTYRIERGETAAKLFDERTGAILADGTTPVNVEAPKILGMQHREFAASYLVLQKDVARIASMGPTERQAFVRQVMGVGRIDDGLKACREQKSKLAKERDGLEEGLGKREPLAQAVGVAERTREDAVRALAERRGLLERAEAAHAEAERSLSESNRTKEAAELHDRQRAQATSATEQAAIEIQRLEVRAKSEREAERRLAEAAPELERSPGLRAAVDQLASAGATVRERERLAEQRESLAAEIEGLRDRIAEAREVAGRPNPDRLEQAAKRLVDTDHRLHELRSARQARVRTHEVECERARAAVRTVEGRIAEIEAAGSQAGCPTCMRALGEAFDSVLESLHAELRQEVERVGAAETEAQMARAVVDDDELEAQVERDAAATEFKRLQRVSQDAALAQRDADRMAERLSAAEAELGTVGTLLESLPSVEFSQARLDEVTAELERIEELDRSLAGDRGIVSLIEDTQARLTERREMLQHAEAELVAAEAVLAELSFDADAHAEVAAAAEKARDLRDGERVALARAEEVATAAEASRTAARRALDDYDAKAVRLEEVAADLRAHNEAAGRLVDFRAAIAGTIRPEMEELMSGFVHLLTDGRHEAVTLTDDFQAVLHESGSQAEVVSGGAEDIAALAMRLAVSQMIAERAGHPLSLLILDEPFGSLDETRRASVLSLIRRLRRTFQQVVVISHVAETRDMVDHAIEMEFDEAAGRSRVVAGRLTAIEGVA